MSRIGVHVKTGPRGGYGLVCKAKPAIAFSTGEGGAVPEAKMESQGYTWGVFRDIKYYNNHPEGMGLNDPGLTKEEAYGIADMFFPLLEEQWELNPADFYSVINESGANDITVIPNYINYEWRMMELAEQEGYKLCLCNLFSGTPDDGSVAGNPPTGGMEHWKNLYGPLLARGYEGGHIYGRHVYGYPMLVPLDHNSDRPFREIEWLIEQGIPLGVALTECGLHGGEYQPDKVVVLDQMAKYDSLMKAYEAYIVGAAWWTYGDWDGVGGGVNLEIMSEDLAAYLAANPSEKWKPIDYVPPNPDPGDYKAIVVKAPQEVTREEWGKIADYSYDFRHDMTASHHTMLAIMRAGNDESYTKVFEPDEPSQKESIALLDANGYSWEAHYLKPDQLDVEPLSQRDARWASQTLGQDTGHDKTIGNWGCLLTAYNMIARYYKFTTMLPDEFNDFMVDSGGFSGQYLVNGAFKKAYPYEVIYEGYKSRDNEAMIPMIHRYIDSGWPVPARVDFKPATEAWEQHWVLIIGYSDSDFTIADPWTGKVGLLSEAYPITGDDVLEALFYYPSKTQPPPPTPAKIDIMPYFTDQEQRGVLYEVRTEIAVDNGNAWAPGPQQRHQTHFDDGIVYHTKGGDGEAKHAEWEQIMFDLQYCYRGVDTSPGDDKYYELRDTLSASWSVWCPRYMYKGQSYQRYPYVRFYNKGDCSLVSDGRQLSLLVLEDIMKEMTFYTGITLKNVIRFVWTDMDHNPIERYYYAIGYGLVAWEGRDRRAAISEIHQPGSRPDNVREVIRCL